ncbi:LysR family transcriptional regulator [Roseobacteraceae bacterium S113]
MIDKLRAIAIFSKVVDQGTFRAAAQTLSLAPSRVSETISELEKDLGVTLLYRSTRSLSLTNEGQVLYEKAREMLASVESGLDAINPTSKDPQGALRITAPAFVTQTGLMDDFAAFARMYPKVDLRFDFSDAPRDLIKDGYDLGIRAGWLEDSDMMTRNIGQADRLLVASAQYLKDVGAPETPADLEAMNWVHFSVRPNQNLLTDRKGNQVTVSGRSHVSVNSADALYEFAARGLGVTGIPENLACRGFDRGELVHVLPDWSLKPLGFHAVWPDQSRRENLTLLFVRHLAEAK